MGSVQPTGLSARERKLIAAERVMVGCCGSSDADGPTWAGCDAGTATVADGCFYHRFGWCIQARWKADCLHLTVLATDATFHIPLGQAGAADLRTDRPRALICSTTLQRRRGAHPCAFATKSTGAGRKIDLRISIVQDDDAGRADDRAVVATCTFPDKVGFGQRPGWA